MGTDPTLNPKVWRVSDLDSALEQEFARQVPVSPMVCRALLNRGIDTLAKAKRFLSPNLDDLYDPGLLDGMDQAVARTQQALDRKEKIMVHGDYDVDGITSAALLVRVLRLLGADVSWYVPHRQREGYDIGPAGVEEAKQRGVGLIITADCGTSALEAVELARGVGIDVIVTDHHEVGSDMASALAVINPRKPGCSYPFKDLAGVGVAFKFAEALVRECGYDVSAYRRRFCDLAAIGTVGDVVPLLDENRTLVKFGMEELPRTGKKGIKALLAAGGLSPRGRGVTSRMLAFVLAPRLNAAGRLDDASVALRLLLTTDDGEAAELAEILEAQNSERQAEQERITREAIDQIASRRLDEHAKVFVLSSGGWHPGVVGIVAGRITDRYTRPCIVVALDEAGEVGVGSARSTEAFDMFGALSQCGDLLERCGGHAHAAGLSIGAGKLVEFDDAINRIADGVLTDEDLVPRVDVDAEIELDSVTRDLASELRLLEPYGHGNPEPIFVSRGAFVLHKRRVGSKGAHLKLRLGISSERPIEFVAFGWGERDEGFQIGSLVDVCYNIQINQFGGLETVQGVLCDAHPSEGTTGEPFHGGHAAQRHQAGR